MAVGTIAPIASLWVTTLSLAVMQAQGATQAPVDSGLEVPPESDRPGDQERPASTTRPRGTATRRKVGAAEGGPASSPMAKGGGGGKRRAMAAGGPVVCLQEFGQYDDWRNWQKGIWM